MNEITINENHEYLRNGRTYPSVTTILSHFGMTPDYDSFSTDYSRTLGSVLHESCSLLDDDNLAEYDPAIEGRLNQYMKFLTLYSPVWELNEQPMIDTLWGYAGTPDRYGIINSKHVVLDIKSGEPDPSHELQTAGYQFLLERQGYKVNERYALYLQDAKFMIRKHTNSTDISVFIALVQAYNWKIQNRKIR